MTATNTFQRYGSVAKSLHWLTVLLIFTAFPLGMLGEQASHDLLAMGANVTEAAVNRAFLIFSLHKTIGVTVFFVALARILWALTQPKPGLLNADNRLETWLAETIHWALYGALVLVPLSGWIHHAASTGFAPIWWPFGQSLPFVPKDPQVSAFFGELHHVFTKVLLLSVALHIAGAIKHHVIDRDSTLRRMLPGRSDAPEPPAQHASILPPLTALAGWLAAIALGVFLWASGGEEHATGDQASELDAPASDWNVESGTLSIGIQQMGSLVEGSFADWTAAIAFDEPDAPGPAGHVTVVIAIPSLSLGSVTAQAMGADFFDAEAFPNATYAADLFKTETGYEARGALTIKGVTAPMTLPFSLDVTDNVATASGAFTLMRLDYNVGANMPDGGSLGLSVDGAFELTARRNDG